MPFILNNNVSYGKRKSWLTDILGLALVLGIFYAVWLGSYALFTPDEGRYSEVAREMVVSGDYITPRLNGVAFLDKPALYYWLQASAIKVFGLSEGALRFWPVCLGVLSMVVLYGTGRLLFNRRTGIIAALILATSPLYYGGAHYANLDLEVASLIADSLLCFIAGMYAYREPVKNSLLYAAYAFAGCAALTKGLIGIVFPALIIGSWILLLNRWQVLLKMRLVCGLLIFFAVAAPWYVLVQKANPEFLHFFFVTQQISRFLTTQEFNSKAPLWFYVPIVLAGFFPWTIFLIQALTQKIKFIWQDRQQHGVELFLLLWLFIVFIFFSIPRSKPAGYILPMFPAMALLTGSYLDSLWNNQQLKSICTGRILFGWLCVVLGVGFFTATFLSGLMVPVAYAPVLRFMGMVLLIVAGINAFLLKKSDLTSLFFTMLVTISMLLLMFISSVRIINERSIKPIAVGLKSYLQPGDEVVAFYKYYQDLPLYLERKVTIVADWHAPDIQYNDNWVREMWYGMVFQDTKNWLIEENTFWPRWHSDRQLYVITNVDNYQKLSHKTKVYKISQKGDVVLLSNKPSYGLVLKLSSLK